MYECICSCGTERVVPRTCLRSGNTKSCGCYKVDRSTEINKIHGGAKRGLHEPEYRTYRSMKKRCLDPKNNRFNSHGGRGVTICERWLSSYSNFLEDMGRKPSPKHSIERIDNNGNYCKENCHWATSIQQANNRRSNKILTLNGQSKTIAEWGRITGFGWSVIQQRLRRGDTVEQSLTTPVRKIKPRCLESRLSSSAI